MMMGLLTCVLVASALLVLLFAPNYVPDVVDGWLLPRPPLPEASSGQPRVWGPFREEDCSVDGDGSRPYKVHVDDELLADLKDRLNKWKAPGAPMEHADGWSYGVDSAFVSKLVQVWRDDYDWRKHEERLNDVALGMSETVVDGLIIRMNHIRRGDGTKAILLLHGWPGSIWEFHTFIQMMQKQKDLDEFSIVCPSLPGYGFSTAPTVEGYNTVAMAGTMHRLMEKLGYRRYIVQGGDWGSLIAQAMAYLNPTPLIGLHLNMFPVFPSPGHLLLDEAKIRFFDDEDSKARAAKARDLPHVLMQTGYFHQQATKPETLGYALSDSPVGMCAWISEKFQSWSDPSLPIEEKFSMDDIITNCMIYWVTNSITSSMRLYKELYRSTEGHAVGNLKVNVPVALSLFPHELIPPADAQIRRKYTDVVLYRKHEKGGHFAALEQPKLLLDDLVAFSKRVRRA